MAEKSEVDEAAAARRTPEERNEDHVRLSLPDVVRVLQDTLGSRLTAHIANVTDAKMVGRWIDGVQPTAVREQRLRDTLQIFRTIMTAEDEFVARAWFIGMNPNLDDDAPADVLRVGRHKEVLAAARTFVSGS